MSLKVIFDLKLNYKHPFTPFTTIGSYNFSENYDVNPSSVGCQKFQTLVGCSNPPMVSFFPLTSLIFVFTLAFSAYSLWLFAWRGRTCQPHSATKLHSHPLSNRIAMVMFQEIITSFAL